MNDSYDRRQPPLLLRSWIWEFPYLLVYIELPEDLSGVE